MTDGRSMRGLIGWVWVLTGFLAALAALATVVATALHFAPAVVYDEHGKPSAWSASWATIAALGGLSFGLLILSAAFYFIFDWFEDEEDIY